MSFVVMKFFEESPRRFDFLMRVFTLGRLEKIRERILSEMIEPGSEVLEVGCGTGSFLELMARKGARVVGIDGARLMVEASQETLSRAELGPQAEARRLHALQIEDEFETSSFDRVVSILAMSEMSDDEVDCLLPQCRQVLRDGGRLVLVDEAVPDGFLHRQFYRVYRYVTRFFTFLGLQAVELQKANLLLKLLYFVIELPLMLLTFFVMPPVTHPLADIERRIEASGFKLLGSEPFLGGSLKLLHAEAVR